MRRRCCVQRHCRVFGRSCCHPCLPRRYITMEELEQALREKGLLDGRDIKDIVAEVDADNVTKLPIDPRVPVQCRTAGLDDILFIKCVWFMHAGRADQLYRVRGDDEERGPGAIQPQEAARRRPVEAGARTAAWSSGTDRTAAGRESSWWPAARREKRVRSISAQMYARRVYIARMPAMGRGE